jgi:hypothetical protein
MSGPGEGDQEGSGVREMHARLSDGQAGSLRFQSWED